MASEAFVENLMFKMNAANMEAISKILETINLNARGGGGGMVDNRGVGRPISFKGDVNKFSEGHHQQPAVKEDRGHWEELDAH